MIHLSQMLTDFCDNGLTDKNTVHSYLPVYEMLFAPKRLTATNVLEIGIGPVPHQNGGSIRMWHSYFINADIHACDIIHVNDVHRCIVNIPRINLYTSTDAYTHALTVNSFLMKNIQFDIVLDDGPHTLQSMLAFINLYLPLLKDDGILAIEDVQDITWIDALRTATPDELKPFIEVYDRRSVKGRYDDIIFVINKYKKSLHLAV